MKKLLIGLAAIFLAANVLWAQELPRRTLTVTGTAEINVSPDICYMSFAVVTEAMSAVKAYEENAVIMNRVNAAIRTQNVDSRDMTTSQFTITPMYHYEDRSRERIFDGYQVTHTLNVKVRNLDDVSVILDAAINAGATRVNSISFSVEDPKKYATQAREEAVKAAQTKAEQMARLTGVRLGKPITISESEPGGRGYYPQANIMMDRAVMANGGASIEPGEIKLTHTVFITYEIE